MFGCFVFAFSRFQPVRFRINACGLRLRSFGATTVGAKEQRHKQPECRSISFVTADLNRKSLAVRDTWAMLVFSMSVDLVMVYICGTICHALWWMFDGEGKPRTNLGERRVSHSAMTGFYIRALWGTLEFEMFEISPDHHCPFHPCETLRLLLNWIVNSLQRFGTKISNKTLPGDGLAIYSLLQEEHIAASDRRAFLESVRLQQPGPD